MYVSIWVPLFSYRKDIVDGFVVDREKKTADASAVLPLHSRAHIQAVKGGTRGGKGRLSIDYKEAR